MRSGLKKHLLDAASAPYRSARIGDYYWARGKLQNDPVFAALLEQQVFADGARILDLGCGRGLLAAWLLAAEKLAGRREWVPSIVPVQGLRFRGVELDAQTVRYCSTALQAEYGGRVILQCADMREVDMREVDAVTILDALHYIPHVDQERLLDRIHDALGGDAVLIVRVGDASGGWRFGFSQIVDRIVASIRCGSYVSTWCRPLTEWLRALESRGFSVQVLPMSRGTFFANFLLICRPVKQLREMQAEK